MKYILYLFCLINFVTLIAKDQESIAFSGPEVFKTRWNIYEPVIADVNGDGKKDILIIDNFKGKIEILLQKSKTEMLEKDFSEAEINDIMYDTRFKKKYFLAEASIKGLLVAPIFDKKINNIVYVTDSKELVIVEQKGDNWVKVIEKPAFFLKNIDKNMTVGDFNGDSKADIAVLAGKSIYVFYQSPDKDFKKPVAYPVYGENISKINEIGTLDFNNDKKDDLYYLVTNKKRGLWYRLQSPSGELSPELSVSSMKSLATWVGRLDDEKEDLFSCSIHEKSRSLSLSKIEIAGQRDSKKDVILSDLFTINFSHDKKANKRSIALGDINGDGKLDIAGTEPGSAQLSVYFQNSHNQFGLSKKYPSLMGVDHLEIVSWGKEKKSSIYVLSKKERLFAKSRYDNGILEFPSPIKMKGKVQCFSFSEYKAKQKKKILFYVSTLETEDPKEKKKIIKETKLFSQASEKDEPVLLFDFKKNISIQKILVQDINSDQALDLILFEEYESPRFLIQKNDETFDEISSAKGFKKGVLGDVKDYQLNQVSFVKNGKSSKEKSLFVAVKNFAREIVIDEDGVKTLNQFNGEKTDDDFKAIASVDFQNDGISELACLNNNTKKIDIYQLKDKEYLKVESLGLNNTKLKSMFALDINNDGFEDLILVTQFGLSISFGNIVSPETKSISNYEPKEFQKISFNYIIAGDLITGGNKELIAIDCYKHKAEVFSIDGEYGLKPLIHFPIFEKRHFSRKKNSFEPRYVLIDDLTGDGLNDILMVVHDRILIYPQVIADNKIIKELKKL